MCIGEIGGTRKRKIWFKKKFEKRRVKEGIKKRVSKKQIGKIKEQLPEGVKVKC